MIDMGLTDIEQDNKMHLNRFKSAPPSPSYIAGFIDGDGCIFIRKIKDGFQSGINISQCRTNILQIIRYYFGGSITTTASRNNKIDNVMNENQETIHKHNIRNQYSLTIRSNEYASLLEYIKCSNIIKETQFNALYQFSKICNQQYMIEKKQELYDLCLNKKTTFEYDISRLNIEYIQGLFDAEGCVYIDNKKLSRFKISITQKTHPQILIEIQKFLGFGKVNSENKYVIYNTSDCLKFLELMKPGVIVKYNQVIAFETFLNTSDKFTKHEMYKICNKEKHQIEHFTDLNQNEDGKEGFHTLIAIQPLEDIKKVEINKKVKDLSHSNQVYKDKSEKMMGTGNHNFGKTFSEEHKKKMSDAIRDAKGGVSDETILEVRKLFNEGKTNVEIQELLQLSRHNVTRIKCGNIICRTEEKVVKDKSTQEERNIAKRKIALDEILIVIDKLIKLETPNVILEFLNDRRHGYKNYDYLNVDVVKNIKRHICQTPCKLPFSQSEMSVEDYAYYKNAIEEYYIASNKI
jgi:hypothetical protein